MSYFKIFLVVLVGISFSSKIFGQSTASDTELKIIAPSSICQGEPLELKINNETTTEKNDIIWSSKEGKNLGTGHSIEVLPTLIPDQGKMSITCKVFTETEGNIALDSATHEIEIFPTPDTTKSQDVSYSQLENSLILEVVDIAEDIEYKWTSPKGEEKKGSMVKFTDLKPTDFGLYELLTINATTKCVAKSKIEVKPNTQDEGTTVFGSIENKGIPQKLYKEVKRDIPVYECTILGQALDARSKIIYPGYEFTIIREMEDHYIIRMWKKKEPKQSKQQWSEEKDGLQIEYTLKKDKGSGQTLTGQIYKDGEKASEPYDIKEKDGNITFKSGDTGKFDIKLRKYPTTLVITNSAIDKIDFSLEAEDIKTPSDEKQNFVISNSKRYNDTFVFKTRGDEKSLTTYRYFKARKADVEVNSISFLPARGISFTAGTVLIPIKLRNATTLGTGKAFEFATDVSLGPFFGLQRRINRYNPHFINLGVVVGISSVRLTSGNSNAELTPLVQDIAAFTVTGGAVFEFDKVQVGLFAGFDRINNNKDQNGQPGYNWAYQNKIWYSIGFGFSIISRPNKSPSAKDKTGFK